MGNRGRLSWRRFLALGGGVLGAAVLGGGGLVSANFASGRRRVDEAWAASTYPKMADFGEVKGLTVLPLIDWFAARNDLATEPGLSYMVRADDTTILFDVGLNRRAEHPSPLLRNLSTLAVSLADVDAFVLSHPHADHTGGKSDRVALSTQQVDLHDMPAYVPVPIAVPSAQTIVVGEPRAVAPGVASTGPLQRQDFLTGTMIEQSLAIKVADKGIVLVIGCGHPTVQHIVARAEMLFDEPIYGVIGGLHYPVTDSRFKALGFPVQSYFGTGKWPWNPINREDVRAAIAFLQQRKPKLVALSPHDSCDWTIAAFKEAFGDAHREVLVGKEIVV